MNNPDLYISPYGNKRKRNKEPGPFVMSLFDLLFGLMAIALIYCIFA